MPRDYQAMALRSSEVRAAKGARKRAHAAQLDADEAQNRAHRLAAYADMLAAEVWPDGEPMR
ncbi:hypothetical protein [Mycobacteroides salmoniphilum]|uniref:hypothetical protein n=1 Tax=Mycobacteroides salmoniphilum TaxID=404941 RepID=UPI0009932DF5|nr:hypothetical protein [Mycobacteroides salmoniphilum]